MIQRTEFRLFHSIKVNKQTKAKKKLKMQCKSLWTFVWCYFHSTEHLIYINVCTQGERPVFIFNKTF